MKRLRYFLVATVALLALGVAVLPTYAQTPGVIVAEVDRTHLTTAESLVLTVSVDAVGGDSTQPALPALDGFNVLGSSKGTQMSLVNGDLSVKATYQYRLQPTRAGNLAIGPITVTVNGQNYSTEPIGINVTQGNGSVQPSSPSPMPALPSFPSFPSFPNFPSFPSLPSFPTAPSAPVEPLAPAAAPTELVGQDFFVEAMVDDPAPYQGEQVIYTFRFYKAVDLFDQPSYQPPSFTGFWSEEQAEQREYTTQAAGRDYRMSEVKTVLYPTVVGEVSIDPAALEIPGGFFSPGQVLRTRPISLNVQPLPDIAPVGFQGAVGRFDIHAEADKSEIKVNDTVTLKVTISGEGNIDTLADLDWPESPDWRAFDSQASAQTQFENDKLKGSRTYERLLVPTTPGTLTLPAIQFSYFDPEMAEYVTISTEAIAVNVVPDGSNPVFTPPTLPTTGAGVQDVTAAALGTQIRPIKSASPTWNRGNPLLTARAGYWLLWTVPLFLLAGHYGWLQRQKHRRDNVAARRSQQAAKKAHQALRQARKQSADADGPGNAAAGQILTSYLTDKLNRPVSGLTHEGLSDLLLDNGIDSALLERVQACLLDSEMGRYAPTGLGTSAGDILTDTEQLIDDLERAF